MKFLILFSFPLFFKHLAEGSKVYSVAYSEAAGSSTVPKDKAQSFVLLTSDGGIAGGIILAMQMIITGDVESPLDLAVKGSDKIDEFLTGKGISVQDGVLLTAGLHEALRYWGKASIYSLDELEELLDSGKEAQLT